MRSARLPLVRKHELTDYRKNQARSILFLLLLTLLLLDLSCFPSVPGPITHR